jgi:hypothetical protein
MVNSQLHCHLRGRAEADQQISLTRHAAPDTSLDDGIQDVIQVDSHDSVGPLQQPRWRPMLTHDALMWPQVSDTAAIVRREGTRGSVIRAQNGDVQWYSAHHPQMCGGMEYVSDSARSCRLSNSASPTHASGRLVGTGDTPFAPREASSALVVSRGGRIWGQQIKQEPSCGFTGSLFASFSVSPTKEDGC